MTQNMVNSKAMFLTAGKILWREGIQTPAYAIASGPPGRAAATDSANL